MSADPLVRDVEQNLLLAAHSDQSPAGLPLRVPADVHGQWPQVRPVGLHRERHVEPLPLHVEVAADEEEDAAVATATKRVVDEQLFLVYVRMRAC